jgi:hypothetical protein
VIGNKVFYPKSTPAVPGGAFGERITGMVDEDRGHQVETANSVWLGPVLAANIDRTRATSVMYDDLSVVAQHEKMVRVEGYDPVSGLFANGKVASYNQKGELVATIGTLPNLAYKSVSFDSFDVGDAGFALAASASTFDLFFGDAGKKDSQVRLTSNVN